MAKQGQSIVRQGMAVGVANLTTLPTGSVHGYSMERQGISKGLIT